MQQTASQQSVPLISRSAGEAAKTIDAIIEEIFAERGIARSGDRAKHKRVKTALAARVQLAIDEEIERIGEARD